MRGGFLPFYRKPPNTKLILIKTRHIVRYSKVVRLHINKRKVKRTAIQCRILVPKDICVHSSSLFISFILPDISSNTRLIISPDIIIHFGRDDQSFRSKCLFTYWTSVESSAKVRLSRRNFHVDQGKKYEHSSIT